MARLTEQDRIAAYGKGWNDAQLRRVSRDRQLLQYARGFRDALRGKLHSSLSATVLTGETSTVIKTLTLNAKIHERL